MGASSIGRGCLSSPIVIRWEPSLWRDHVLFYEYFDTGGGSSQFTFGQGDLVSERFSVNVGAVRYTERYRLDGAVSGDVLREAMKAIAEDLSRIADRPRPEALVAMGGAVTNLTAVSYAMATYDPDKIQGTVLERARFTDKSSDTGRRRGTSARPSFLYWRCKTWFAGRHCAVGSVRLQ
jgi:hypothetical protein